MTKRLSICYAAPGHTLVSTAGSARNILAAADALSAYGDVTVAFREGDNLVIKSGLNPGERVILSDLPFPIAGTHVRVATDSTQSASP